MSKSKSQQRTAEEILLSDDEYPDYCEEFSRGVPAYLRENRFDEISFPWLEGAVLRHFEDDDEEEEDDDGKYYVEDPEEEAYEADGEVEDYEGGLEKQNNIYIKDHEDKEVSEKQEADVDVYNKEDPILKDLLHNLYSKTASADIGDKTLIFDGMLSSVDIMLLRSYEATASDASFMWLLNFLSRKDVESCFKYPQSCLVEIRKNDDLIEDKEIPFYNKKLHKFYIDSKEIVINKKLTDNYYQSILYY